MTLFARLVRPLRSGRYEGRPAEIVAVAGLVALVTEGRGIDDPVQSYEVERVPEADAVASLASYLDGAS